MEAFKWIAGTAFVSLLMSCSDKESKAPPAVPVAASPAVAAAPAADKDEKKLHRALMQAVFGDRYRTATEDALAELRDPEADTAGKKGLFLLTAVAHGELKTGEMVLVANAQPSDHDGHPHIYHSAPGLLNVFILKREGEKWTVLKRHENIDGLGSNGHIGHPVLTVLSEGRPGLAVEHGGTWQGFTIAHMALYDLSSDVPRNLVGETISVHSSSASACEISKDEDMTEDECWDVSGVWRFEPAKTGAAYGDLVIDFSGVEGKQPKDGQAKGKEQRVDTKVNVTARYAFDGQKYRLVQGVNPAPAI